MFFPDLDFFIELDAECGKLTLHSSTQELVHYVGRGLCKLKNLWAPAPQKDSENR